VSAESGPVEVVMRVVVDVLVHLITEAVVVSLVVSLVVHSRSLPGAVVLMAAEELPGPPQGAFIRAILYDNDIS
jgi:hypothetical protein